MQPDSVTDQGKLGNVNGMAIAAEEMGRAISDVRTTGFFDQITPVGSAAL